jgi:hypothetical protein
MKGEEIQTVGSGRDTWQRSTCFGRRELWGKVGEECAKLSKPEVVK